MDYVLGKGSTLKKGHVIPVQQDQSIFMSQLQDLIPYVSGVVVTMMIYRKLTWLLLVQDVLNKDYTEGGEVNLFPHSRFSFTAAGV